MNKFIYYKQAEKWINKNHKYWFKKKIESVLLNGQPSIHLTNSKDNLRRIRIHEQYRVIFKIENNIFFIIKIGNRDDVYKNLDF